MIFVRRFRLRLGLEERGRGRGEERLHRHSVYSAGGYLELQYCIFFFVVAFHLHHFIISLSRCLSFAHSYPHG